MATHPLFLSVGSFEHYPDEAHCIEERDACIVPTSLWFSWVNQLEGEILLVELKQNERTHTLVVETHHDFSQGTIYVAPRYANDFNIHELVEVKVVKKIPPIATKIKLNILEDEFQGFDLAAAASEYLSHWNILSKGTILSIPCPELEGYPVEVLVADVEPENLVLLRGEVNLEIETHEDLPPPPSQQVSSALQNKYEETTSGSDDDFASLLPQHTLIKNATNKSFNAFSGTGYRLGS